MPWVILAIAGLLEIVWATSMKASDGFTKFWPSVLTVSTLLLSFWLLSIAVKSLPLGTSYMVWAGVGAVGTFIAGVIFLDEALTFTRVLAGCMIVGGIVVMKLGS
ncbi:MAG: multidrug efflux SMR transporter [Pseudomonadota bacterium]|nr:multidrug efflux SMR transporter [Pseudomonadota bacterium]